MPTIHLLDPCCSLSVIGTFVPSRIRPRDQPSGPSNVARDSSVNRTFKMSALRYFLVHEALFLCIMGCILLLLENLCYLVQYGTMTRNFTDSRFQKLLCSYVKVIFWRQMIIISYLEVKTCSCLCRFAFYVLSR